MDTAPHQVQEGWGMSDKEFLEWIRDRIVHVYGESPNTDFVLKLGEIAQALLSAGKGTV